MVSDGPAVFYTALDPLYYESLNRYVPKPEFRDLIQAALPTAWACHVRGVWTNFVPPDYKFLDHGWKLHFSAHPVSAMELLTRIVPILASAGVAFKVLSDPFILRLASTKNWGRTAAGKFVTIYPYSAEECWAVADALLAETKDVVGPYLLTDRPYKGSQSLFYRYGEHASKPHVAPSGARRARILSPDGTWESDERVPYFRLPSWVQDPFQAGRPKESPRADITLNDRYLVLNAMRFSALGGLYAALDQMTGATVVLREARPHIGGGTTETDARAVLAKEARILRRLEHTGLVPKFIDYFTAEGGHEFLVQERLEAESLWGYAINITHDELGKTSGDVYDSLVETFRTIARGLEQVHACGIVLRDLTKTNVMFTQDAQVRFIDFELSYELDGTEEVASGFTHGYASVQQLRSTVPTIEEDHYALGALLLDMVAFTASGYTLNRSGTLDALSLLLDDLGLPQSIRDVVVGLTCPTVEGRWAPARAVRELEGARPLLRDRVSEPDLAVVAEGLSRDAVLRGELTRTVDGVYEFIRSTTSLNRSERLWPSSAEIFSSHPASLQFGASGVASFLHAHAGSLSEDVVGWIAARATDHEMSPGLYSGAGGISLFLAQHARYEEAGQLMARHRGSPLLSEDPSLYWGAAGWGLANVAMAGITGEGEYLDEALAVASLLERQAIESEAGVSWRHTSSGVVQLGLAHGQAGIALFFTYLALATETSRWFGIAERALAFEWSERHEEDNKLLWFPQTGASAGAPKSPHIRFGTSGIGAAVLRYAVATDDPIWRARAEQCAHSVTTRFTNKLWHDFGLAGYGDYLLDCHSLLGDERWLDNAFYVAKGLLAHRIFRPEGVAFTGMDLVRICCDFSVGSAGIGHFLTRLLRPTSTPRLVFPDSLLPIHASLLRPASA
jgi:serine/threonine protein kinase